MVHILLGYINIRNFKTFTTPIIEPYSKAVELMDWQFFLQWIKTWHWRCFYLLVQGACYNFSQNWKTFSNFCVQVENMFWDWYINYKTPKFTFEMLLWLLNWEYHSLAINYVLGSKVNQSQPLIILELPSQPQNVLVFRGLLHTFVWIDYVSWDDSSS